MKTERFDGTNERRILIGMITRRPVLASLAACWPPGGHGPFPSRWANVTGRWCVDYFARHQQAPGRAVQGLFAAWAATKEAQGDEATVQLVERFLESLSEEYEAQDPPADEHLIEQAGKLFDRTGLRRLIELMQGHLDRGDVEAAEAARAAFRRAAASPNAMAAAVGASELTALSLDVVRQEPLVIYPGDLGKFFGRALERDAFVAFQAPEKRGKSFALIDLAWRAMTQRKRTLFFAAGDMSQVQMHRRFIARVCKRPLRAGPYKYPKAINKVPKGKGWDYEAVLEERVCEEPVSHAEAMAAYKDVQDRLWRSDESFFDLGCWPAGHLGMADVRAECLKRADAGKPADVVVIDYADLIRPPAGVRESRDQINAVWQDMRALAGELHCLVVTATQARRDAYHKRTQDMADAAEDKRKLAHATGIVGLNCEAEEKGRQLQRWNWIVLREEEFVSKRCVVVAQCLPICNPCVRSTF